MLDPKTRKTTLNNGVRIVTKELPHAKSVSLGIWLHAGARDETIDQNGISHFIEHMIFKGTKKRSALDIARQFDSIGGQTNAFTGMETTCFHARVLDECLSGTIDILTDIFLHAAFDPTEMEKERSVIFQEISMVEDVPEEYALLLAEEGYFANHPLGRPISGTLASVSAFQPTDLRNYFQTMVQTDRIVIAAAGNVQHEQLVDKIAPAFMGLQTSATFPERITPVPQTGTKIHMKPMEQANLCLICPGVATTHKDRYAFYLLNSLLGGNMSSRLFQRIREQRGLAYSIESFTGSFSDTGTLMVYAGIHPKNATLTATLILEEMDRLAQAFVDEEEVQNAKEFVRGSTLLASESTDNQMVRAAQNEIQFDRHVPLQETLYAIEAVTPADIQRLAAKIFTPNQCAITLLCPKGPHVTEFKKMENTR